MAISKTRKEELVAQYVDLVERSGAIFITEYTGMNVKTMDDLRNKVYESNGEYHVTKNTLLKYALESSNRPVPEEILVGQVATGFALGEAPTLAKTLADFADSNDTLTLRGGILGDNLLTAAEVQALAKLPSLDQLRAQIIGLIGTPAQNIASVVAGGVRQIVNVLDAYAKSEDDVAEAAA